MCFLLQTSNNFHPQKSIGRIPVVATQCCYLLVNFPAIAYYNESPVFDHHGKISVFGCDPQGLVDKLSISLELDKAIIGEANHPLGRAAKVRALGRAITI